MIDRDWELTNAYADDELDAEQRALFASRLESETALRDALATVLSVKAGVRAAHQAAVIGDCTPPREEDLERASNRSNTADDAAPARRRRLRFAASFAAGLALLAAAAASYTALLPAASSWQDDAIAVHDSMSGKPYAIQENNAAEFVSSVGYRGMPVPDLRPSSLYYAGMDSAADYLALHYRGRNGCSLTVLALTGVQTDRQDATAAIADGHLFRTWRDDDYRYVVIAQGMDGPRFDAIAAFVESDIRRKRDIDEQLRVAMAETYRLSAPCA